MEIIKIGAAARKVVGKGASERLRREGQIPAVAYGKKLAPVHLSVSPKELLTSLKSEHGKNSVVELAVPGEAPLTVLVRDYSYHPLTRALEHVDFVQIKLDEEVDVEVPFTLYGKSVGVTAGGILRIVYRMLPVRCLPEKIPVKLEHDMTAVGLNESVHASAVKVPEGVKIRLPDDQTVAAVVAPEKERAEDVAATGAAPAAAGAAGAAAAPAAAAGAKAAAPAAAAKEAPKKKLSDAGLAGSAQQDEPASWRFSS